MYLLTRITLDKNDHDDQRTVEINKFSDSKKTSPVLEVKASSENGRRRFTRADWV